MLLRVSESREKLIMKITDKECFTFIKGIAIISMIVHHAFGFPAWYVDGISYPDILPYAEYIRNSARLCIPIFVFLTGGVLASGDRDHILSGVFNQFLSEKSEPAE